MPDLEDLFPDGRWSGAAEYIVKCPICLDTGSHNHCSINPEKGVFRCLYCGAAGKLKWLIKEYAGNQQLSFMTGTPAEKKTSAQTALSQFREFFDSSQSEMLEKKARVYLQARGISSQDIEDYQMRWADGGRYFGRVILPVFEDERMVCFCARAFLPVLKPKYLFPHTGETLLTNAEAIFDYDQALHSPVIHRRLVLVEGIFDAIAVNKALAVAGEPGAFALSTLSKAMSDGQFMKLLKFDAKATEFFVMMDPDAVADGIKIAKRLSSWNGNLVRVCQLQGAKDPAEATFQQILAAMAGAALFGNDLELRAALGLEEGRERT